MKTELTNHPLVKIFSTKYEREELAHFYILDGANEQEQFFKLFSHTLLTSILKKQFKDYNESRIEKIIELGHADIEIIKTEEKNYGTNSDEVERINKFFHYQAESLNYKILMIHDAHKLSVILANKLLKVLEEPPAKMVIFLLNPHGTSILNTIRSRAINLRVKNNIDEKERKSRSINDDVIQYIANEMDLNIVHISDLIDVLKKKEIEEEELYRHILHYIKYKSTDYTSLETALSKLKDFELKREFNQSFSSRTVELLTALQN